MKRLALLTVAIVLAAAMNVWAGEERPDPGQAERSGAPPYGSWIAAPKGRNFEVRRPSGISRRHFPPATGNAAAGRAY